MGSAGDRAIARMLGAELLSWAGDARGACESAIALTANALERGKLERRLGALR